MAERTPTGLRDADGRPMPEQATMGLLDYITGHALDEDYAHVSEQRGRDPADPAGPDRRRGRHLPTLLVLAAFGVLVATAGIQTARNEPVRRSSQESLAAQVKDRRDELVTARDQVTALRREIQGTQADALTASRTGRALRQQLDRLGLVSGTEPARGPGVRIVVDNSPDGDADGQVVLDTDLQILVNGLWVSGAEAVAINGQRLTNLSSIRVAGDAITVNLRSLARPYVVTALGDPDQLAARFVESDGGTWWLNLKAVYDLQFTLSSEESLTVPAAPAPALRHARRLGGER